MGNQVNRNLPIASAIAVAVLALAATTATAHKTTFDTGIVVDDFVDDDTVGKVEVTGHLTSPKGQCKPRRSVTLFAVSDEDTVDRSDDVFTALDTDRTNANGAFFVEGTYPGGTDYFVLRALRKNIGPSGHRHICRAARARFN